MVTSTLSSQAVSYSRGRLSFRACVATPKRVRPSQYSDPLSQTRSAQRGLSPMSWAINSGRCTRLTAPLKIAAPVDFLRCHMNPEVALPSWATAADSLPTELTCRFAQLKTYIRLTLTSTLEALNKSPTTPRLAAAASAASSPIQVITRQL